MQTAMRMLPVFAGSVAMRRAAAARAAPLRKALRTAAMSARCHIYAR